jgi:hypothetical protein
MCGWGAGSDGRCVLLVRAWLVSPDEEGSVGLVGCAAGGLCENAVRCARAVINIRE